MIDIVKILPFNACKINIYIVYIILLMYFAVENTQQIKSKYKTRKINAYSDNSVDSILQNIDEDYKNNNNNLEDAFTYVSIDSNSSNKLKATLYLYTKIENFNFLSNNGVYNSLAIHAKEEKDYNKDKYIVCGINKNLKSWCKDYVKINNEFVLNSSNSYLLNSHIIKLDNTWFPYKSMIKWMISADINPYNTIMGLNTISTSYGYLNEMNMPDQVLRSNKPNIRIAENKNIAVENLVKGVTPNINLFPSGREILPETKKTLDYNDNNKLVNILENKIIDKDGIPLKETNTLQTENNDKNEDNIKKNILSTIISTEKTSNNNNNNNKLNSKTIENKEIFSEISPSMYVDLEDNNNTNILNSKNNILNSLVSFVINKNQNKYRESKDKFNDNNRIINNNEKEHNLAQSYVNFDNSKKDTLIINDKITYSSSNNNNNNTVSQSIDFNDYKKNNKHEFNKNIKVNKDISGTQIKVNGKEVNITNEDIDDFISYNKNLFDKNYNLSDIKSTINNDIKKLQSSNDEKIVYNYNNNNNDNNKNENKNIKYLKTRNYNSDNYNLNNFKNLSSSINSSNIFLTLISICILLWA